MQPGCERAAGTGTAIDGGRHRRAPPAVAADRDRVAAALAREAAERLSDDAHDLRRQRFADDAADVVSLEDFGSDIHSAIIPARAPQSRVRLYAVGEELHDAPRQPGK